MLLFVRKVNEKKMPAFIKFAIVIIDFHPIPIYVYDDMQWWIALTVRFIDYLEESHMPIATLLLCSSNLLQVKSE